MRCGVELPRPFPYAEGGMELQVEWGIASYPTTKTRSPIFAIAALHTLHTS